MLNMLSPIEAYVQRHLRFNFTIGMLDGSFFGLGMGFASFTAIIPLFVHHLTDSALLIGLVPAIHNIGWQLPQLLMVGWMARVQRYKPLVLLMTINERVPFLLLAIVALQVSRWANSTILVITFLLLIMQGCGAGLAANPWTGMISKVMPRDILGTFFGTQSAAFNAFAGISAVLAGIILDRIDAPRNFSICFALTFVCMSLSFLFLSMTREPKSTPARQDSGEALWSRSLAILRTDKNFLAFLVVRILSQFGGMAFAFYVIYAVQQYNMSDGAAGVMVAILLIGQVVLSPVMGRLGDRWSHRGVMSLGALGAALSAILAWQATSVQWFYGIFLLEAVAVIAIWTTPLALSVAFARHPEERPIYIGMANTLPAPAAILAPIFGGWLADIAGYPVMFVLSAVFALSMAAALWFVMKDPEKQTRQFAAATAYREAPGED